ncbi:hypothetical protein ACLK15_19865 [Escherichia coli]
MTPRRWINSATRHWRLCWIEDDLKKEWANDLFNG